MEELVYNQVPGMTEPAEQKMLYELARIIKLKDDDTIYEFGPYFGRSTYYLAKGLKNNPTKRESNTIHTFDAFQCAIDSDFAPRLRKEAQAASVANLLEEVDGNLRFVQVFEHYLQEFISTGLVNFHAKSLSGSYPAKEGKIALMHIDSPKTYTFFKNILFRFFPLFKEGIHSNFSGLLLSLVGYLNICSTTFNRNSNFQTTVYSCFIYGN